MLALILFLFLFLLNGVIRECVKNVTLTNAFLESFEA